MQDNLLWSREERELLNILSSIFEVFGTDLALVLPVSREVGAKLCNFLVSASEAGNGRCATLEGT